MPSHQLSAIKLDQLEILGYSVAGEETVVAVPQLDVCFDIGKAPDQTISINHVLLTHGHMDHAAGFAYYLSHRIFDGQAPGTLVVPRNLTGPIQDILDAWGRLDGNTIPVRLIGVVPGDEVQIKSNLIARAFQTAHCYGSVGYTLLEIRKKLKPEYRELPGPELVKLKKDGVNIENHLEIPLVTYLGDTQPAEFSQLDYVANSKVLITECTFYDQEHIDRAKAGKHMHVGQFKELAEQMNNEHIVIIHTTQRTSIRDVKRQLKKKLPESLHQKVTLLMDRSYAR